RRARVGGPGEKVGVVARFGQDAAGSDEVPTACGEIRAHAGVVVVDAYGESPLGEESGIDPRAGPEIEDRAARRHLTQRQRLECLAGPAVALVPLYCADVCGAGVSIVHGIVPMTLMASCRRPT